jgi:MFS family permease
MCLGQLGNLLPHVTVPAVMPQHLMPLWSLSGAQAGLMASAFAFGYMLAVPVLTTLTDRIDARLILLVGSTATALATLGFGLFADGLWSATLIWGLAGVGFAGAYMPGLKALTDRLPAGRVAGRFSDYGTWPLHYGRSVLGDACRQAAPYTTSPARFRARTAQPRGHGVCAGLRRTLL